MRSKSDKEFIESEGLQLETEEGSSKFLIYRLEKMVKFDKRVIGTAFMDNCLEYRLDRRITNFELDGEDNVKLAIAVSGAGKTRMLLELLHRNFGYYFTVRSSQSDFGSKDLEKCISFCDFNRKEC